MKSNEIRIALVSPDEGLRSIVLESIRDAKHAIRIALEIQRLPAALDPEEMERIQTADPHVVILDMGDQPDRAIRVANAIGARTPRAALVGVGPQLESDFLLEAMRAGVVEYVTRPAEPLSVYEALGRVMRKRGWIDTNEGHRRGKILSFFSAKGGSGSTSVATNVGIELHRLTGRKTLLVDLDLELGEIASLLGIQPRFHFVDLVRNFHRMDADLLASYIESHESGVQVLSAPFQPEIGQEVTQEQIGQILQFLRSHYDYVVVDTSKSLAPPALATFKESDQIFLVTNVDVPSLRNLKRCLPTLAEVTGGDEERLRLVVNRFNKKGLVGLKDLEETLGIGVYATLCNDFTSVIEAMSTGRPLVLNGTTRFADQVRDLARDIADDFNGSRQRKKSFVDRLLAPFRPEQVDGAPVLDPRQREVSAHG
ncbi:MAG: AAA family ATPase [Gemmatimonadales bacterium]|jgi:pilus assembly protein CpaE|nr:MAG: AAA family ATPase [Gemmatimonadales bacterium]